MLYLDREESSFEPTTRINDLQELDTLTNLEDFIDSPVKN